MVDAEQRPAMPKPGPVDLVVYHIGGEGNIGPVEAVIEATADNALLVIFEIRDDKSPFAVKKAAYSDKQFKIKVNRAVDEKSAQRDFHITSLPLSSSLLKPSPMAEPEDPGFYHCTSWAENTTVVKSIPVKTTSIADVIAELGLPPPDIISIDAQGAEWGILKGAGAHLANVVGVVTEVEFSEIYHHQHLFDDQMALLTPHGMRLVNLFNSQIWHPGPRMKGNGFLTVAEAVFVKYFHEFSADGERPRRGYAEMKAASTPVLLKTCMVAVGFRLLSYAVKIAAFVKKERNDYQALVAGVPALEIAFTLADYVANHGHLFKGDLDIFIKAVQFPDSINLKYPVPDTSVQQWAETKKRFAAQQT